MNEPEYWGTYHRSESSRFFSLAGGRKKAQFLSPCVKKHSQTHSFAAHTGGYHSPLSIKGYSDKITLQEQVCEGSVNVRDRLLQYKNRMAKIIVEEFTNLGENKQKQYHIRPVVYTENNYPCVLVALPVLNFTETQTGAAKYWEKHPKPFQRLLLCSFIAFLNVEAIQANIPIEIVLRASFGHNVPSVCETNNTFRINVGLIPERYAVLIAQVLHKLNQAISKITDETSSPAPFNSQFLARVRIYNAKQLKKKIKEKERYKTLRNSRDFQKSEYSDEAFERLYNAFKAKNNEKSRKGKARFQPVRLKNKTIWEAIRQAGDSMGKSVLSECFRQRGTEDWFINQMMNALLVNNTNPIETALGQLLQCLRYGDHATMAYEKIHRELKCQKRTFKDPSFEGMYSRDPEFSSIVALLCDALLIARPTQALYAELERANAMLCSNYRGNSSVSVVPDHGSESEFSDELTDVEEQEKKSHISHVKLRVCSGMKAILLAQYGALSYLNSQGAKTYAQDVTQMYYEVEDALRLVDVPSPTINNVRAAIGPNVLHFDINHCNSSNAAHNQRLKEKLDTFSPTIVILDYTSSTLSSAKIALQQCFSNKKVTFVMLVDSGLKNNQGGADFNPYGEVRICARNRRTVKTVFNMMKNGLSEQDKLTQKAHEMARVYKRRGMAFSLFGLFKTDKSRFQITEESTLRFPNRKF